MLNIEILSSVIDADKETQKWSEPGWCRRWSDRLMDILEDSLLFYEVEAREIEISSELWHTFVRAETADGEVYIFDNSRSKNRQPYIGPERNAPEYLNDSKRDNLLMTERWLRNEGVDNKQKDC